MNRIQYKDVRAIAVVPSTYGTVKYLIGDFNTLKKKQENLDSYESAVKIQDDSMESRVLKKIRKYPSSPQCRLLSTVQQNTLYIINGGMELNTSSIEQLIHSFASINDWLEKNNIHIGIIRGTNDDPSLFNRKPIHFSNVKMYDDCTIASIEDKNILCIGGGCSIDKSWKINKEKYSAYRMYYAIDEHPTFSLCDIENFLKENDVTLVVSALAPTFVGESYSSMKSNKWLKNDNEGLEEISAQRIRMDELYTLMIKNGICPKRWYVLPSFSNSDFFNEYNDIGFVIQSFNKIGTYKIETPNKNTFENAEGRTWVKTLSPSFFGTTIEVQEQRAMNNAFRYVDING